MTTPQQILRRTLLSLLALTLLLYFVDFVWYELRVFVPRLGYARGSVHRVRMFAIPAKDNKVEFQLDTVRPEEDLPCAHSLLPEGGFRPCWYVTRHANDPFLM